MAQAQPANDRYPQGPDEFTKRMTEAAEKQEEQKQAEEKKALDKSAEQEFVDEQPGEVIANNDPDEPVIPIEEQPQEEEDELDPLDGSPIEFKPKFEQTDGKVVDEMKEQFTMEAFLRDAPFPATKEQLLAFAQSKNCGPDILGFIQSLPDNLNSYDTPQEIIEVLEGDELSEEELAENAEQKPDAYTQRVKKAEKALEKAKREEEKHREELEKEEEMRLEKE